MKGNKLEKNLQWKWWKEKEPFTIKWKTIYQVCKTKKTWGVIPYTLDDTLLRFTPFFINIQKFKQSPRKFLIW